MSPTTPVKSTAFMPAILRRLAPELGATIVFEPEFEIVGRITFRNGRKSFFWHNKFNFNSVASARVAQDKGYTSHFLKMEGMKVPNGQVFLRESFRDRLQRGGSEQEAVEFARKLNWQVYLKPLRRSQGNGVVRATTEAEFVKSLSAHFERERMVLVEEVCAGRDYRFVVLDGEVISAYERRPLSVLGDGSHSVAELLSAKQESFSGEGRDTIIDQEDPRIGVCLERMGIALSTVPKAGQLIILLDVANLSCGGTTHLATSLHPSVRSMAANVADILDLRFAGVDVIMPDASSPLDSYHVIEVNSAPGLDHYAGTGPTHDAEIDALYLKLLKAIERGPREQ